MTPIEQPASGPSASGRGDFGERGRAVPANRIEVARAGDMVLLRVIGLGSMNNAGLLWDFAMEAMEAGSCRLAFDLGKCRGLDSTFLGTLVGLAQEADERAGADGWVCAFNVSEANRELFDIVGVARYVRFRDGLAVEPIEMHPLAGEDLSPERRLALVRRAHENLIKVDERNQARFGDFLKCLAAEMARPSAGPARRLD